MGQGRNAVWLATQGWQVTGFDPATGVRIGEAVLFSDNELIQLFSGLRVLQYEDVQAPSDFGEPNVRAHNRHSRQARA